MSARSARGRQVSARIGLPTSSSHAPIGGYAGAAVANAALKLGIAHALRGLIVWAWVLTLPASAIIAALAFSVERLLR